MTKIFRLMAFGLTLLLGLATHSAAYADNASGQGLNCDDPALANDAFCQCINSKTSAALNSRNNPGTSQDKLTEIVQGCLTSAGLSPIVTPSLTVSQPAANDGSYTFTWQASNYPQNSTLTFYASTTNNNYLGQPISESLPVTDNGSFTWDGGRVSPGKYFVYAELRGPGVIPPKDVWATPSPIAVDPSCDVVLALSGQPEITPGKPYALHIKITNNGPRVVTNPDVIMQLPEELSFLAGQRGLSQMGNSWRADIISSARNSAIEVGSSSEAVLMIAPSATMKGDSKTILASLETPSVFNTNQAGKQTSLNLAISAQTQNAATGSPIPTNSIPPRVMRDPNLSQSQVPNNGPQIPRGMPQAMEPMDSIASVASVVSVESAAPASHCVIFGGISEGACQDYPGWISGQRWTPPVGASNLRVLVVGGGGGGTGGINRGIGGAGGGSGEIVAQSITLGSPDPIYIRIGTGGAPGVSFNNGSDGTSSYFGSITASGGHGGNTNSGGAGGSGHQGGSNGGGGGGGGNYVRGYHGGLGGAGGTGGTNGRSGEAGTDVPEPVAGTAGGTYSPFPPLNYFTLPVVPSTGGSGGTYGSAGTGFGGGGGGGAGGVAINNHGRIADKGASAASPADAQGGAGGFGYGAGGGGSGNFQIGVSGGKGADGVVYVEW